MRKLALFLSVYSAFSSLSFAAPCYGTKLPKGRQFFMGLGAYSVLKRELTAEYGKVRSLQDFFLLTYGIFDWLSIDLKGGAGNIKYRPDSGNGLNYPVYLAGGYGFRLKFYDTGKSKAVFGFQHISVHPWSVSVDGTKHKSVLDDWQFSLLASYEFSGLTPYIGTRWSRMDNIHWVNGSRKLEKSALGKSVGLITGIDIPLREKIWVNLEGQYFDTAAVSASLNYAF